MALFIGPVVALLGVIMVLVVIRTKAKAKKSLYSSLRQDRERKVREIRERTLGPKSRAAAASRAFDEPSSSASIPPSAQASRSAWDVSPTMASSPSQAPPPVAPSHPQPPAQRPAAAAPPPAAPSTPEPAHPWGGQQQPPPAAPVPPVTPEPAQPAWQSAPPAPSPANPVTAQPGQPAWAVMGSGKEMAGHVEAGSEQPQSGQSWQVVGQAPEGGRGRKRKGKASSDRMDDEEVEKKESSMQVALSYAGLVAALVVVLLGVILMVGSLR